MATLTKQDWDRLRTRYLDAVTARRQARQKKDIIRAEQLSTEMEQIRQQYFASLPIVNMSCCPFDGLTFRYSFDPHGVQGFWWQSGGSPVDPPACEHFRVLRGAVNYVGKHVDPTGGFWQVRPGPEVPYVIPRLLSLDGMLAVISELSMTPGYVAYPITYYSSQNNQPKDLAAGWCQSDYYFQGSDGRPTWRSDTDPWDFDLQKWIDIGKLRWCMPGSGNTKVLGPPDECPYVNLPGERLPFEIGEDTCVTRPAPDGSIPDPWD